MTAPPRRILVVDDELALTRAYARILGSAGFDVTTCKDGMEALRILKQGPFHAVLSDIAMPGMDGLGLIRIIREHALDLPVLLVTGFPTVETVAQAMEHGAVRYLLKPVERSVLVDAVERACMLREIGEIQDRLRRHLGSDDAGIATRSGDGARLDRFLATLRLEFAPIVDWTTRRVVAWEILRGLDDAGDDLESARALAATLGRSRDVGRTLRDLLQRRYLRGAGDLDVLCSLHASDLQDPALFAEGEPTASFARRVVLEIAEPSVADATACVRPRLAHLRSLGYRFSIRDFGLSHARGCLDVLEPRMVRLDPRLTRGLHLDPPRRALLAQLATACRDLDVQVVGTAVETPEEREALVAAGVHHLLGPLFVGPGEPFHPAILKE